MGAIFVENSGGGGPKEYRLALDSVGSYDASTTVVYTMRADGFVVGDYGGHNSSNTITIYLNGMQIGRSDAGRMIAQGLSLYRQLAAGDVISIKGNSNRWNGAHLFFFEEA